MTKMPWLRRDGVDLMRDRSLAPALDLLLPRIVR
jgi:hypothetical protein